MSSGGARARSGPPPDPNALRRDRDKVQWARLPASGRTAEAPAWPLARPTKRELVIWADEWRRPQALMWEERRQEREVALYVRALVTAEAHDASPPARRLVLTFMDDLGISQGGLAKNHWIIEATPEPRRLQATGTDAPSAKSRLKVLDGGG